ncbi:MAG: alpha/beta hydrolase [Pseudomonadota bacterium]
MREAVVLVHGIWMPGWEMVVLRRRLEACDYTCHQFRYHSVGYSPQRNALRLAAFLSTIEADIIHLVAHSLGGIVVLHLFERDPMQRPGRILLLGTPLNGSSLARRLYGIPLTRPLLGKSVRRGLLGDVPPWKGGRELGMIAGSRSIGSGALLFGGLERPNDGTVALSETRSSVLDAHLTVPHSHMGMLLSSRVAKAACSFLRTGEFVVE